MDVWPAVCTMGKCRKEIPGIEETIGSPEETAKAYGVCDRVAFDMDVGLNVWRVETALAYR